MLSKQGHRRVYGLLGYAPSIVKHKNQTSHFLHRSSKFGRWTCAQGGSMCAARYFFEGTISRNGLSPPPPPKAAPGERKPLGGKHGCGEVRKVG